jgi:hypothetical protein
VFDSVIRDLHFSFKTELESVDDGSGYCLPVEVEAAVKVEYQDDGTYRVLGSRIISIVSISTGKEVDPDNIEAEELKQIEELAENKSWTVA